MTAKDSGIVGKMNAYGDLFLKNRNRNFYVFDRIHIFLYKCFEIKIQV